MLVVERICVRGGSTFFYYFPSACVCLEQTWIDNRSAGRANDDVDGDAEHSISFLRLSGAGSVSPLLIDGARVGR